MSVSYRGMSGSKDEEEILPGAGGRALALGGTGGAAARVVVPAGGMGGSVEAGTWGGGQLTRYVTGHERTH